FVQVERSLLGGDEARERGHGLRDRGPAELAVARPGRAELSACPENRDGRVERRPCLYLTQGLHGASILRAVERKLVPAQSSFADAVGYSRAVRVGEHVFVAGTAPIMADRSDPPLAPHRQAER